MDRTEGSRMQTTSTCEGPSIALNEGHILYALEAVKNDIISSVRQDLCQGLDSRFNSQKGDFNSISADMAEKIAQEVASYMSAPDRSKSSDQSARSRPPPLSLKHFALVAGNKQAVIPFLQWTALATVVSFTNRIEAVRTWIPEKVYTKHLAGSMDTICAASGLSAVLFSVKTNEAKQEKLECPVGRLWSFVLRNSMTTVLQNGMLHFSNDTNDMISSRAIGHAMVRNGDIAPLPENTAMPVQRKDPPAWLRSFGKRTAPIAAVNSVVDKLEGKDESGLSGKKRKLREGPEDCVYERYCEGNEKLEELKFQALKQMRSNYMTLMNHGRTDVRAYLFTELFFLTERISKFESFHEAREQGFEIILEQGSDAERQVLDAELQGSIWDIPNARTIDARCIGLDQAEETSEAQSVYSANQESMRMLQERFPSLYVTLKYRMSVQPPQDESEDFTEDLTWPCVHRVSLQRIATGVLMEIFKAGSHNVVLGSSVHSIKAVHAMAIGLRGLLRRFLHETLSEIEQIALGEVTHEEVRKCETVVTAMMETKPKRGTKSQSRVETIRGKQFLMPWADYKIAKANEEEERRRRLAALAPVRCSESESDEDDDIFSNIP